jgi:hypothetical protein
LWRDKGGVRFGFVRSHPFRRVREKDGAPTVYDSLKMTDSDLCFPTLSTEKSRKDGHGVIACAAIWIAAAWLMQAVEWLCSEPRTAVQPALALLLEPRARLEHL